MDKFEFAEDFFEGPEIFEVDFGFFVFVGEELFLYFFWI